MRGAAAYYAAEAREQNRIFKVSIFGAYIQIAYWAQTTCTNYTCGALTLLSSTQYTIT